MAVGPADLEVGGDIAGRTFRLPHQAEDLLESGTAKHLRATLGGRRQNEQRTSA